MGLLRPGSLAKNLFHGLVDRSFGKVCESYPCYAFWVQIQDTKIPNLREIAGFQQKNLPKIDLQLLTKAK